MIGVTPPMNEDNVIQLDDLEANKSLFTDTLTEIARTGAQQMLAIALQAEVDGYIEQHQSTLGNGHQRLIKNGYLPTRSVQTGIGDIAVKVPRVKDKEKTLKFSSSIVPPYMKRSLSLEKLLPLLYLKGISTGDFKEVRPPSSEVQHYFTLSSH